MAQTCDTGRNGFLAARATSALLPALPYWSAFMKALQEPWTPENPDGYISMAVAENRLSSDLIQAGLQQHAADWPTSMLYYQDSRGIAELRSSFAHMLQRTTMQGVSVDPEHLTVLTGCGSVIDLLLHCTAEPGDVVLIPAPYYPAFDNDLRVRNQVEPVPVHLDLQQQDLAPGLEAAAAAVRRQGKRVAAVLFTNPTNPQGLVLSRQQVRSIITWCCSSKAHCIADEVYSLSVFDPSAHFVSAAQVLVNDSGSLGHTELTDDLVHVVVGASKDFCGSGLRIGVLYSKNAALNLALGNLGYFCSPPAPLQMTLSKLLADEDWLDGYLAENKRRMRAAYSTLTSGLDAAHIAYTPAPAGMFVWVDLRAALCADEGGAATWQDEAALWQHMVDVHKVVLTPGSNCHAAEPGFFRMCWAWPHPGSLPTAVQRIKAAVTSFKCDQRDSQLAVRVDQQCKVMQQAAAGGAKGLPDGCNGHALGLVDGAAI